MRVLLKIPELKPSHSLPITLHQLDNIAFWITKENDPTAGDDLTHINDRIGFDAVCSQCFNSRFKPRHLESQMLKSDTLFTAFLVLGFGQIGTEKFQSDGTEL